MKVLALMLMVAVVSVPMAWAGGDVQILGSYVDPITGQATQFVNAKSNDAIRGNQSVIYAMTTDQELVTLPNGTKRWQPTTKMSSHDNAMSNGILNNFMTGGFAGLAQMGGLMGAAAIIRPTNVSQSNNGGNASQSQGQGQGQGQFQQQKATGGAGGAGGSATVNVPGGIGNTNSVDINGNNTLTFSPITQ